MNHSNAALRGSPHIVPPDVLLKFGYSPYGGIQLDSAAASLSLSYAGTPRVDITASGMNLRNDEGLVIGHTAQIAGGGVSAELQVLGTGAPDSSLILGRFSADAADASIHFVKGRDGIGVTDTDLNADDSLGEIRWHGVDITDNDFAPTAALIAAEVDGTPGNNDMPGRLVFSTTAGGLPSATERMRIDSTGSVFIGDTADTDVTLGLTINQGGSDDHILTLKSSDVSNGTYGGETDTYGAFSKNDTTGGLEIT